MAFNENKEISFQGSRKNEFIDRRRINQSAGNLQENGKRFLSHQEHKSRRIQNKNNAKCSPTCSSLKSAIAEYHNVKQKKIEKRRAIVNKEVEIRQALDRYKQKKREKNKKILSKTSKGQPVMRNRIEMLLEKIQQTIK